MKTWLMCLFFMANTAFAGESEALIEENDGFYPEISSELNQSFTCSSVCQDGLYRGKNFVSIWDDKAYAAKTAFQSCNNICNSCTTPKCSPL